MYKYIIIINCNINLTLYNTMINTEITCIAILLRFKRLILINNNIIYFKKYY